jgi:hypothetical protein
MVGHFFAHLHLSEKVRVPSKIPVPRQRAVLARTSA